MTMAREAEQSGKSPARTKDEQISALANALRYIWGMGDPMEFEQITQHEPDGTYTIFGKTPEKYWRGLVGEQHEETQRIAYEALKAADLPLTEPPKEDPGLKQLVEQFQKFAKADHARFQAELAKAVASNPSGTKA